MLVRRRHLVIPGLLVLLTVTVLVAVAVGSVWIEPWDSLRLIAWKLDLTARPPGIMDSTSVILFQLRLPRVLLAAVVGGALAAAGAVFQALFRNPMADPAIIGVSSGAALGAITVILAGGGAVLGGMGVPAAAFVGALATCFLVYRLARLGPAVQVATLLLAGIAVAAVISAGISLAMTFSGEEIRAIYFWLLGGLGARGWQSLAAATPFVLAGAVVAVASAGDLNLSALGEERATQLGLDVERFKRLMLVTGSLLTAAAVSVAGLIGFVGLMTPHLLRLVLGSDHRRLIPASILGGAAFMVLADLAARTLLSPEEIPVGAVTAVLGGPFFLYLLRRERRSAGARAQGHVGGRSGPMIPAGEGGGLELTGVSAGYGGRPVIEDVSVAAVPGEVTGLIGPNGSGKTTLIRVASRGLRPSRGQVRVLGRDPYALSSKEAARLVAVVPQELTPAFEYSVLEMVLMGRSPYRSAWGRGNPDDWVQARRAMAAANVQHLAERGMGELSGGERQRTILAQALAQEAPILLLDEPTTHLDVRHVVEILSVVRGLTRREGRAVLAIFHDLNLASAYCDRIYALAEGRVVAAGSPSEVLTHQLVRDVFGVEAEVSPSGATGRPAVVVAPPVALPATPWKARAHVIGGAGRAAPILRQLVERGFEVTAGVLHAGDTDEAVAERLNLFRVTVPPFSDIDARSAADCRDLISASSLLVVCDAPFGPGNVENLRLALEAVKRGTQTVMVEQIPIEERDFTEGLATRLWRALREEATVVRSAEQVGEVAEV